MHLRDLAACEELDTPHKVVVPRQHTQQGLVGRWGGGGEGEIKMIKMIVDQVR